MKISQKMYSAAIHLKEVEWKKRWKLTNPIFLDIHKLYCNISHFLSPCKFCAPLGQFECFFHFKRFFSGFF